VRELLFGPQHLEIERKHSKLDAHLSAAADELRKEMRRRLEMLEGHLTTETGAIAARLESDRAAQSEALARVARDVRTSLDAIEQRVTKAEEAWARSQREVRQQILSQSEKFFDEIEHSRSEIASTLEHEITEVRHALEEGGGGAGAEGRGPQAEAQR
jgi:hypothetical protein